MCKVYKQIGSLTVIKSHLRLHNLNEYQSLNGLINFQKNYTFLRQQIIANHKLLIENEQHKLDDEITQLENSIAIKKNEVERQLVLELGQLQHQLDNLLSTRANMVNALINYFQKITIKQKILKKQSTFEVNVADSLKYLNDNYVTKTNRYQYIVSRFDDAVTESSLLQTREIDFKKRIIDQVNSSIYGALGEQKVVKELEKLADDYTLINDFTCTFHPPIYNRQENDHIMSIQIDHILIAPSGIFLIETKNWSQHSLNDRNLYSPVQQIKRANFALYKILNGEISSGTLTLNKHYWGDRKIPLKNLIVFINHKPIEEFQYVKILLVNELLSYVNYFKPCFSTKETQEIANYLLNFRGDEEIAR